MKVFLSIGNSTLEEVLRTGPFEVIDSEDDLNSLYDLLEFVQADALIINSLLDTNGTLLKVSERAVKKGIKVLVLVKDFTGYDERKLITSLVNVGVTGFLELKAANGGEAGKILQEYPDKFDFGMFAEQRVEYKEVVRSVFKQVITVYSPASQGATTIAAHLAAAIAKESNSNVCILDYNPLKPWILKVIDTTAEFSLQDALDAITKGSLTTELLQGIVKPSKHIKNLYFMPGLTDMNDYYTSTVEQYEEIIRKVQLSYDYVVIDTHSFYDMLPTDAALRFADKVVVPVEADKYSIEHLNRYIKMFEQYDDYDIGKFHAVFNRYSGSNLTSIEAESITDLKVLGYISYDKSYTAGQNAFNHSKVMKEYGTIIKKLDIKASGQVSPLKRILGRG